MTFWPEGRAKPVTSVHLGAPGGNKRSTSFRFADAGAAAGANAAISVRGRVERRPGSRSERCGIRRGRTASGPRRPTPRARRRRRCRRRLPQRRCTRRRRDLQHRGASPTAARGCGRRTSRGISRNTLDGGGRRGWRARRRRCRRGDGSGRFRGTPEVNTIGDVPLGQHRNAARVRDAAWRRRRRARRRRRDRCSHRWRRRRRRRKRRRRRRHPGDGDARIQISSQRSTRRQEKKKRFGAPAPESRRARRRGAPIPRRFSTTGTPCPAASPQHAVDSKVRHAVPGRARVQVAPTSSAARHFSNIKTVSHERGGEKVPRLAAGGNRRRRCNLGRLQRARDARSGGVEIARVHAKSRGLHQTQMPVPANTRRPGDVAASRSRRSRTPPRVRRRSPSCACSARRRVFFFFFFASCVGCNTAKKETLPVASAQLVIRAGRGDRARASRRRSSSSADASRRARARASRPTASVASPVERVFRRFPVVDDDDA